MRSVVSMFKERLNDLKNYLQSKKRDCYTCKHFGHYIETKCGDQKLKKEVSYTHIFRCYNTKQTDNYFNNPKSTSCICHEFRRVSNDDV
ncbi:hypothetical protein M0R19_08460 [Candidatus Pacearchaeota archaeon]|nr:hypothetical protein [Candidatus Pacearchaeota archaeon]